jgi:urease accessory protein
LPVLERESKRIRGNRPFVFTNLRAGESVIADFIEEKSGLGVQ